MPSQKHKSEGRKSVPAGVVFEPLAFPQTLYVQPSLEAEGSGRAPFEGYTEFETAEEGDEIGVYVLQKVTRVKVTTTKSLEDLTGEGSQ